MPFTPFVLPVTWLVGLLSLALLGGGAYLIWLWYVGAVVGAGYLVAGCASVIWTFAGRWIILTLWRRPGADEPDGTRTDAFETVRRPDGTELRVEVYGRPNGPTIVLTHGWGTTSTEWYYARRALGERFRVIVWDLRGVGKSRGPSDGNYRLETMAEDLEAVVDLAGEQPVVLLGHSMGGMITQIFYRRLRDERRHRVAGLILVNTTYTNPALTTSFSGFCRAMQGPLLTPLLYLTIWLSPIVRLMNWLSYLNGSAHIQSALTGFTGHETRGQLDFTAWYTPLYSPGVLARGALATFDFDETAALPTIDVPTLVVTGHLDRVLIPEASVRIQNLIPAAQLEILRPAGHMGLLEQHVRFNEVVARFSSACFARTGVAAGR